MKTPTPPSFDTDPDAPPSEDELRKAGELRDALCEPTRSNDDATFARALVLAHSPHSLHEGENRALVERALAPRIRSFMTLSGARARRSRRSWVAASVSLAVLAAALWVFLGSRREPVAMVTPRASAPRYARSTQALFHEPFPTHGGASARIDRIASARAADLRENRFARWEVR
jgi:hypothetical protein